MNSIKSELLRTGRIIFTNKGRSMMPLLRQDRDLMIIETPKAPYRKLDAVLFERPNGGLVLHRILKVENDRFWIIGDNCSSGEYVPKGAVLGLLTAVKRGDRMILVTDRLYQFYVRVWCAPYRFRIIIQYLFRLPLRCARKAYHLAKRIWKNLKSK